MEPAEGKGEGGRQGNGPGADCPVRRQGKCPGARLQSRHGMAEGI